MIDEKRFFDALSKVTGIEERDGIGTLSEKPLHKILKFYIEPDKRFHEA
jgi:hypothetical protein